MSKRYLIVAVTALASMLMYIDRVCFSTLINPIQTDLQLTDRERALILGAFFFTYAFFQIPIGALADRFGPRLVLSVSIAAWSLVTAATGLVESFAVLLVVRFLLGFTESGAYPAAAALVKRWAKPDERAKFSSAVALGGRIGGAMAPKLTSWLAVTLFGVSVLGTVAGAAGVHWRGVFLVYGVCGVAMAGLFWLLVRDYPPAGTNTLPVDGNAPPTPVKPATPPRPFFQQLAVLGKSRRMWFFGGLQFCSNIPWAILITLLPAYLQDRGVEFASVGGIQSQILFVGCAGMLVGGIVSDYVRRKLGPRWGRSVPIMAMTAGSSLMCITVSTTPALGIAIAALGLMAMFQDTGIPSVWAFAQDVGGKNVGAALGFGNMLGNFGAALSPIILTEVKLQGGWEAVFAVGAASYLCAAAFGSLLDTTTPLDPSDA